MSALPPGDIDAMRGKPLRRTLIAKPVAAPVAPPVDTTRPLATCRCGSVRAICTGAPLRVLANHSPDSQRRSGSAFAVDARFAQDRVSLDGPTSRWSALEGDGTRDVVLEAARVDRAKAVVVSTGRDDTSILVVLTARRLAPRVPISVVVKSYDNEALARQAGANTVINPASFTGLLLAGSVKGAHIADYLADLASVEGRVQLVERVVSAEECGRSITDLTSGGQGLRVYRNGRPIGFWEPECQTLQPGDVVVEIVPTAGSEDRAHPVAPRSSCRSGQSGHPVRFATLRFIHFFHVPEPVFRKRTDTGARTENASGGPPTAPTDNAKEHPQPRVWRDSRKYPDLPPARQERKLRSDPAAAI